jgi:hypothetical protein
VLYSTELRGISTYIIEALTSRQVTSLLYLEEEWSNLQLPIAFVMSYNFPRWPVFWAVIISAGLISGCSASEAPLSINLYNPKTGVQRTCAAKESSSKDVSALSNAVETCAKQLEALGFVRSENR